MLAVRATGGAVAYTRDAGNRRRWLAELSELLSIPTVSSQPEHAGDIQAGAHWLAGHLRGIGLRDARVLAPVGAGRPSVFAEWRGAPGKPTVLFYGHFDVQPAQPRSEWRTPPFRATITDGKLFARGASDDKGQLFTHLKAIESVMRTTGRLPINVKVWLEGEEEANSPGLPAFLDRFAGLIAADAVFISDTEMPARDRPTIIYGLRGTLAVDLIVRGARHDVHAGRFGGAILNPAQALCEIIAGMTDATGRIRIEGFYDCVRPVSASERELLRRGLPSDSRFLSALDAPSGWGELGYSVAERVTIRPALVVNGMSAGGVGVAAKSVIPSVAAARIGFRLVPDQDPDDIRKRLLRHLTAASPAGVTVRARTIGGSRPVVLPRAHPIVDAARRAVSAVWGREPAFVRSGGSIPLVEQLHRRFGVPVILLGFGLPDDDIHAPNEKVDLGQFFRGVETVVRFLEECAA